MRFQAMDRNNDGVITREEWNGSARSFEVHDWNGDGRLSGNEVRIGGSATANDWKPADHAPGRSERYLNWTRAGFTSLDHNRDNRITANEWHFDLETFRRVDRNRDNVLNLSGVPRRRRLDDDRDDSFDDLDFNNNGRVERTEWHGGTNKFSALDRNSDGVLSRFEVVGSTPASTPTTSSRTSTINRNGDDRSRRVALVERELHAARHQSRRPPLAA